MDSRAVYDTGASVKSWGRRGIVWGGVIGFALSVAFVAIPLTPNVLTSGLIGILMVATVEGAAIAGASSAIAAALYGIGVPQGGLGFDRSRMDGRRASRPGVQEAGMPMSEWLANWAYPGCVAANSKSEVAQDASAVQPSLQCARIRSNLIAARESGSTRP